MSFARRDLGQASVELLATLPLVVIVALAGWQLVVAGHTFWKIEEAARSAARVHYAAEQRGESAAGLRRGRAIASALLASSPARSRRLSVDNEGVVTVRARVPLVEPFRSVLGPARGPVVRARSRMRP